MRWQLVGFAGTALFTSSWLVQSYYARRARQSIVTPTFWILSALGNLLLVVYFGFGRSMDVVGVIGNVVPLGTAFYNLTLIRAVARRRSLASGAGLEQGGRA